MKRDRPLPEEPLFTPKEAAAKLNMSLKNLMEHVRTGRLRFINIGAGKVRKRYRFTSYNLETFLENQKERMVPECQSTNTPGLPTTKSNFKSTVIPFGALPKPATRKRQRH